MTATKDMFLLAHGDGSNDPEYIWYITEDNSADFAKALANLLLAPAAYVNSQFLPPPPPPPLPMDKTIFITFHYGLDGVNNLPTGTMQGLNNTCIIAVRCPINQTDTGPTVPVGTVDVCYVPPIGLAFAHLALQNVNSTEGSGWIMNPQSFVDMLNANTVAPDVTVATGPKYSGPGLPPPITVDQVIYALAPTFRFHYEWTVPDSTGVTTTNSDNPCDQCIKFAGEFQLDEAGGKNVLLIQVDEAWSMRWQDNCGPDPS